jgi:hypothetical protein
LTEQAFVPCSQVSRALGEPITATASHVRAWLLVEQPGPWGRDALTASRLDRELAAALADRAKLAGVRAILLRRPGRPGPEGSPLRQVLLASTGPRSSWLERRWVADPAELLGLDLDRLRGEERPGLGELVTEPVMLVCVNGSHDRCCATEGRPVAAALAGRYGDRVWECSHIGGDRFAGNLVVFPHGLYFGRVTPETAPAVAGSCAAGRIELAHYRGRCGYDMLTQAAEHAVRERTGLLGVDDVRLVRRSSPASGERVARFTGPDGAGWRVRVRAVPAGPPRALTCTALRPGTPPRYDVVELATLPRSSG